jgi:hypothetical protein
MNSIAYQIRLTEPSEPPGTIGMAALRDLCDAVIEGAERALRLRHDGVSARPGTVPEWIRRATCIRVTSLGAGSTVIDLDAPTLNQTGLFGDGTNVPLQEDLGPDATALTVFFEAVEEARAGNKASEHYDPGVLESLLKLRRFVRTNTSSIEIRALSRPAERMNLTRHEMKVIRRLKRETPSPQAMLLTGTLDAITHTGGRFSLLLEGGGSVRGIVQKKERMEEPLRSLWGRKITAQGVAHFHASGRIRLFEVASMRPASDADRYLIQAIQPMLPGLSDPFRTSARGAIAELWGRWPGDESVETLLAALREDPPVERE